MFGEEALLPLSGLQHLLFCPRRFALVYLEQIWDENRFTMDGRLIHERVHKQETDSRRDVRTARGLLLRSLRLGLTGKADVVEFHKLEGYDPVQTVSGGLAEAIVLDGVHGFWRPFPVEYKVGRLRHERGYEVQLCAQALCLEEMLCVQVPAGALFYKKTARRLDIAFDERLRMETEAAAARLHKIFSSGKTPTARYEKKCDKCSLLTLCMPKVTGSQRSVQSYVKKATTNIDWEDQ